MEGVCVCRRMFLSGVMSAAQHIVCGLEQAAYGAGGRHLRTYLHMDVRYQSFGRART